MINWNPNFLIDKILYLKFLGVQWVEENFCTYSVQMWLMEEEWKSKVYFPHKL